MNTVTSILPLFVTLFICTLDGYSMMSYRVTTRRAYAYFAAVTILCLALNSYIILNFGSNALRGTILFTIGIPYFVLILLITRDKISQTVFNFWLWINIYEIIANLSAFVNDYTFKNESFLTALRFVLFVGYFFLYNRILKTKHKSIMENLNVNWWIFSFIPLFFTVLIWSVNYYFYKFGGYLNYPILLIIHILMLLVYALIFYTFKTVHDFMKNEIISQNMKEQIRLQKKQYEFYLEKRETERIFRHDARHRDALLLGCLDNGDIEKAKTLLNRELSDIHTNAEVPFCDNTLVNAVLTEYSAKAQSKGILFSVALQMPQTVLCDEAMFCVMLSNLLENSIDAAKSYINLGVKQLNSQLSINIQNDYGGTVKKDAHGNYITTKKNGTGLGLKSVAAILKNNGGFFKINDENGVFNIIATMKN